MQHAAHLEQRQGLAETRIDRQSACSTLNAAETFGCAIHLSAKLLPKDINAYSPVTASIAAIIEIKDSAWYSKGQRYATMLQPLDLRPQ